MENFFLEVVDAPTAPFLVVVGQWGGAGGAVCEEHLALAGRL